MTDLNRINHELDRAQAREREKSMAPEGYYYEYFTGALRSFAAQAQHHRDDAARAAQARLQETGRSADKGRERTS